MPSNPLADCPACGTEDRLPLPVPAQQRAVLSDGTIVPGTLLKVSCMRCGMVTYATPPSASAVSSWYGDQYTLNASAPGADRFARARAANYARWLCAKWDTRPPPKTVFEVGCGNAMLLSELRELWPSTRFSGIDPAPAASAQARAAGFEVISGPFPTAIPPTLTAELVVSVNVIEHVTDPGEFLVGVRRCLGPRGMGFIVCPDGDRPNIELLFADHLYSFTVAAFSRFAKRAGLYLRASVEAPADIGTFALHVVEAATRKAAAPRATDRNRSHNLFSARVRLLEQWRQLDRNLAARLAGAGEVIAFGVGDAAAMLRAYAPTAWNKVKRCTADIVVLERFGNLPVIGYEQLQKTSCGSLLLAVQPAIQRRLAARLEADGWRVITWDDLVSIADAPRGEDAP